MAVLKQVEEIRIYDINQEAAQKYCQELSETYGVRAVAVESVEAAVRGGRCDQCRYRGGGVTGDP